MGTPMLSLSIKSLNLLVLTYSDRDKIVIQTLKAFLGGAYTAFISAVLNCRVRRIKKEILVSGSWN